MKTKLSLILASLAMAFSVGTGVAATNEKVKQAEAATYSQTVDQYYSTSQQSGDAAINWDQTGATLKTNLYKKIKISSAGWDYDDLWDCYEKSDTRADGTLWDIYSDATSYTSSSPHSGTSGKSGEGDYVNREHMIPQSIFSKASPMVSDPHHVLPSDGYINNMRSNYPHGIVSNVEKTSNSGCKLGIGTGNTKVFEPMDKYKGDIARIYFYFVTCYENRISGYTFEAFQQNTYPSIDSDFLSVYLQWAKDDPVDAKEIARNNAIYAGQGNRNPFIDCPYAVGAIWDSTHASDYGVKGQYTSGDQDGISISKSSVSLAEGETTTIFATSSNGENIDWSSDNTSVVSVSQSKQSSGSNITLTAGTSGTAKVTASITISEKYYSATCNVTVTSSGGGGGDSSSYSIVPGDLDTSYPKTDTSYTTESGIGITAYYTANYSSKIQFKSGTGYLYNNSSLNLGTLTFDGLSGSLTVYGGSSVNPSSSEITGSSGVYDLSGHHYFKIANESSSVATCTAITVGISSSEKTLSSISVNTAPTKIKYNVGEYFDPTGLAITRTYSDSTSDSYTYANHTTEFTFTPNTTTALTTNIESVKITYGGKDCYQAITVSEIPITSITATVKNNRTFFVGETISKSDIEVTSNTSVDVTNDSTFSDYKFTYDDATSGGASKLITFSNGVSYGNLFCNLTVQVRRKAYSAPSAFSDELSVSDTKAETTSYVGFSDVVKNSSAVYAGNNAKNGNSIQLRDSGGSGIWTTSSGGNLKSITVNWNSSTTSGRTLNVYLSNNPFTSPTTGTLKGTIVKGTSTTFNVTGDYTYAGVKSNSGAMYLESITFQYGSEETAKNVSNYIMYEDTKNQCNTKLTTAIGYLNNLTQDELDSFASKTESQDYVIYTARTRLNAWAASKGKTINYSTAGHVVMNSYVNPITNAFEAGNATTIIIVIGIVGLTALGGYIFIRKRKEI